MILQAMGQENRQNAVQVVKKLLSDEGWIGLYRGLGPRFFSMSAWGTSMILAYEYLSMDSYLTLQILVSKAVFNVANTIFVGRTAFLQKIWQPLIPP